MSYRFSHLGIVTYSITNHYIDMTHISILLEPADVRLSFDNSFVYIFGGCGLFSLKILTYEYDKMLKSLNVI